MSSPFPGMDPYLEGYLWADVYVEVIRPQRSTEPSVTAMSAAIAIPPAPVAIPIAVLVPTRLVTVEVHDVAQNTLVTSIEIVSPADKREPGLREFLSKRDDLRLAGVHVLEIDLLRRGRRTWSDARAEESLYIAVLIRAGHIHAELWPIGLRDPLPLLPMPLRHPDPDVPLDVQQALNTIYDEARYGLTLDYDALPPAPPLSSADLAWLDGCVRAWRQVGS
jgi:Protein of unknown function (DUF4058)